MRILYIHQYFASINGKSGTRSYEFSKRWSHHGHDVVILTSTVNLNEEEINSAQGKLFKRLDMNGVSIYAVDIPYRQNMSFANRCLSFLLFSLSAIIFVLIFKKPKIIYATSTPLTVGIPAIVGKWLRKIPFVFEVRDQWPEIPIEMKFITNRYLCGFLIGFEKLIYYQSAAIVALSNGVKRNIKKLTKCKKISVFPNCADLEFFNPSINGLSVRKKHGWENKVVFLHPGAMGKVNNLRFIVEIADQMKGYAKAHFVLMGEGSEKERLREIATKKGLQNLQFLDAVEKDRMPEYLAACDVGIVVIGNYRILQNNSANKFFDILSSGKPVLLNYSGWQKDIIDFWKAGIGCSLCDSNEFINAVFLLSEDEQLRRRMGANSRRLAEREYDRDNIAFSILKILNNVD
jgi:glycosyltransferase involved in cell wall biosynthesis